MSELLQSANIDTCRESESSAAIIGGVVVAVVVISALTFIVIVVLVLRSRRRNYSTKDRYVMSHFAILHNSCVSESTSIDIVPL